jgi:hypothetical protein
VNNWRIATTLVMLGCLTVATGHTRAVAQEVGYGDGKFVRTGLFSPAKSAATKARDAEQSRQNETANLDNLFPAALSSGKAIVIIPTPSMDIDAIVEQAGAGSNLGLNDLKKLVVQTLLTWTNRDAPNKKLKVGIMQDFKIVGRDGYFFAFNSEQLSYLVYFVDPGTYDLTGAYFQLPRANLPAASPNPIAGVLGVGKIVFEEFDHSDGQDTWEEWQPEQTERVFSHNVCTQQIVSGPGAGACLQSSPVYVTRVTRQAGMVPKSRTRFSKGLLTKVALSENFASFTVLPGEAILVDGLFPEHPVSRFNNANCNATAPLIVECAMRQFSLNRLSGSLEAVQQRQAFATQSGLPQLARILASAKYRPLVGRAGEGAPQMGRFGKIYLISK